MQQTQIASHVPDALQKKLAYRLGAVQKNPLISALASYDPNRPQFAKMSGIFGMLFVVFPQVYLILGGPVNAKPKPFKNLGL